MSKSCCIILAAGLSSRMGSFKPLLPIHGRPAIVHLISTMQSAGVGHCIVVTGHRAEELTASCSGLKAVSFVHNPDYSSTGMLESARIGFRAIPGDCSRILLTPADIPLIPASVVRELLSADAPLIYPSYHNRKGHPVVFDAVWLEKIISFHGEGGLRSALAALPTEPAYLITEDPHILMDMDTPEDYQKILKSGGGIPI